MYVGRCVLKKIWSIIVVFLLVGIPIRAYADDIGAYAYCLYCANNGEILKANRENEKLPMASTTKIMTALVGLESDKTSDNIVISSDMYAEGSSMYLADGEVLFMRDIIGGMLMVSGNDAANAIALTVGGSYENFADMMNKKAEGIGLFNTHFVTPSGLDAEGHYSTALDLCKLMSYCMSNSDFAEIDKQRSITINFVEPKGKTQTYYNLMYKYSNKSFNATLHKKALHEKP